MLLESNGFILIASGCIVHYLLPIETQASY